MQQTEQQRRISEHRDGAMIVLAGAGSGKTTTISARAAELVRSGYCLPPEHLMLTFSRKAAREMRLRCVSFLAENGTGVDPAELPVETYHAFGYRLLRDNPDIAGRRDGVTLQDDADRKRVLKGVVASMDYDYAESRGRFDSWYSTYSLAKNYGLCASDPDNHEHLLGIFGSSPVLQQDEPDEILRFAQEYEHRLRMTNTMDFDDLCLWGARGLRDNADLARDFALQYPVITVDEAQDTNLVQYEMVNAIARHHRNITLVGDDDQSIYGWRGARVENMERFIRDYEPVQARLERNFRSTPAIVQAASTHISHNSNRLDKSPFAEGDPGTKPILAMHSNGWAMADAIADQISASIQSGTRPGDIAVLYRTNRMARVIEGGLRSRGIPYNIVGGHSLYDSSEVKAAIAGARVMINGNDRQAVWQLLPHIPGLGKKGLLDLFEEADDDETGITDVFGAAAKLGGRYLDMMTWLDDRIEVLKQWGPERAGAWVLADEGLGYSRSLNDRAKNKPDFIKESQRRQANLATLDSATRQAQGFRQSSQDSTSSAPLQQRFQILLEAQISDPDIDGSADPDAQVVLSTAHRAKGLEWSIVHIAGYSEGLMPMDPREGVNIGKHMAEERRLSYVAITRAKTSCVLHHPHMLRFPGDHEMTAYEPSSFLSEFGVCLQSKAIPDGSSHFERAPAFQGM